MNTSSTIDLAFPVTSGTVPVDHGYLLYAALSKALPEAHDAEWLAVHPLTGKKVGLATLMLTRNSAVTLRLPAEYISQVLPLAGKALRVGEQTLSVGAPVVRALETCDALFCQQVVLRLTALPKGTDGRVDFQAFETRFLEETHRQLTTAGIKGEVRLVAKRTLHIKGQRILGYAVEVVGLQPDASLELQRQGIGGKRRMGCGVFRASRRRASEPS